MKDYEIVTLVVGVVAVIAALLYFIGLLLWWLWFGKAACCIVR